MDEANVSLKRIQKGRALEDVWKLWKKMNLFLSADEMKLQKGC